MLSMSRIRMNVVSPLFISKSSFTIVSFENPFDAISSKFSSLIVACKFSSFVIFIVGSEAVLGGLVVGWSEKIFSSYHFWRAFHWISMTIRFSVKIWKLILVYKIICPRVRTTRSPTNMLKLTRSLYRTSSFSFQVNLSV